MLVGWLANSLITEEEEQVETRHLFVVVWVANLIIKLFHPLPKDLPFRRP